MTQNANVFKHRFEVPMPKFSKPHIVEWLIQKNNVKISVKRSLISSRKIKILPHSRKKSQFRVFFFFYRNGEANGNNDLNSLYLNGHDNTTNVSDMPTPVEKDILVRLSLASIRSIGLLFHFSVTITMFIMVLIPNTLLN